MRIFVSNGFSNAEDLADETVDRVIKRLPDIRDHYEGPKAKYFHGVVRNILRERWKPKEIATDEFPISISEPSIPTDKYTCLLKCLDLLSAAKRDLILDYYLYSGHEKAGHRRRMALSRGISDNALRVRAHHIKRNLLKCVKQCLENLRGKQKPTGKS